jgi:hypothetical protein
VSDPGAPWRTQTHWTGGWYRRSRRRWLPLRVGLITETECTTDGVTEVCDPHPRTCGVTVGVFGWHVWVGTLRLPERTKP